MPCEGFPPISLHAKRVPVNLPDKRLDIVPAAQHLVLESLEKSRTLPLVNERPQPRHRLIRRERRVDGEAVERHVRFDQVGQVDKV